MKYDYCLLCRIAVTRLTSDRFISWHVTRVIFGILPWFIVVLTKKAKEYSLLPASRSRSSLSMVSRERERPSRQTVINIQEGANKEHRPSKKRVIRPCEESWKSDLCYGKVWLPNGIGRGGPRASFHSASNSFSWESFSKFNYVVRKVSRVNYSENCLTN